MRLDLISIRPPSAMAYLHYRHCGDRIEKSGSRCVCAYAGLLSLPDHFYSFSGLGGYKDCASILPVGMLHAMSICDQSGYSQGMVEFWVRNRTAQHTIANYLPRWKESGGCNQFGEKVPSFVEWTEVARLREARRLVITVAKRIWIDCFREIDARLRAIAEEPSFRDFHKINGINAHSQLQTVGPSRLCA